MANSFGELYKITTFGESHSAAVGVIIDGCPAGIEITKEEIQVQLSRRKPGQNVLTTPRVEDDEVQILSGIENNKTLGTPLALIVRNKNQKPSDYSEMQNIPRPSHADFTYQVKYGIKASSGGGRASARETIGSVAGGSVADIILRQEYGIEIVAWVNSVHSITAQNIDFNTVNRNLVDSNIVRCPDANAASLMEQLILQAREEKDSLGGIISCVCRNVPAGIGEPVFDKLEARLAHAMLAIPATKGFEIGSGFSGAKMKGSEHNDVFIQKNASLGTLTNNSGGVQGGISNGENIYFNVAFKPVATIGKAQTTVDFNGNQQILEAKGRHDPCVLPRAVPIVESMAAIVLLDLILIQNSRKE